MCDKREGRLSSNLEANYLGSDLDLDSGEDINSQQTGPNPSRLTIRGRGRPPIAKISRVITYGSLAPNSYGTIFPLAEDMTQDYEYHRTMMASEQTNHVFMSRVFRLDTLLPARTRL